MRRRAALICFLLFVPSCRSIPKATSEELAIRDQWANLVPATMRQQVYDEAARHTEWGEKRQVRFEVERFEKVVKEQNQRKIRATQPASKPTTRE